MATTRVSPLNFILLLERVSEPLGLGIRGDTSGDVPNMTYFYYEDPKMLEMMVENDAMKRSMKMIQARMRQVKGVEMIPVPPIPQNMPDLRVINHLCPKRGNFCYFLPAHKKAFSILKSIFMEQSSMDTLFQMVCACRDHPMINCQLFVYALCSCLVSRRDTLHMRIPGHYEVMPDCYCGADVVRQANKMSHMPEVPNERDLTKHYIMIDQNRTGSGTDPEQKLWYFREDILVNSHHFHWHVVFPTCSPKDETKAGYRHRRGELFYYMHHSMIARYDTERLCAGLSRTRKFNFSDLTLEEGYFGKLTSENANQQWGTRQAFTRLSDVSRVREGLRIRIEELQRWRDRIIECIDLGTFIQKDPQTGKETRGKLDEITGIDILGDIVESSATLTPHTQYYGEIGFHNMGHVLIAFSHDPTTRHRENPGVMGDVSTAMRDPAFYRWHKYIDHLFDLYKQTLPPYPLEYDGTSKFALKWEDVRVVPNSFYVKAQDTREYNKLRTLWDMKDVDLTRGLDFMRDVTTGMRKAQIIGRFTHLNHIPFDYFIKIENVTNKPVRATLRIFLAPKHDENGHEFVLEEQRLLFFEMDKVSKVLKPGINDLRIFSQNSSVTLRDENGSSFKQIETLYREAKSPTEVSQCSCGWPQHLLLPRGTPGGMQFDLFVIVTDGKQDMISVPENGCHSASSFCGVLNHKYPDQRPMGFPFDRRPFLIKANPSNDSCPMDSIPVPTLSEYVKMIPNASTVPVTIYHDNVMNKDKQVMEEQVMFPDGKCAKMKDYYQMNQKQDENTTGWKDRRPPGNNTGEINFGSSGQDQWGGIGSGRGMYTGYGNGRRGRESDNEWEHLGWGDTYEY